MNKIALTLNAGSSSLKFAAFAAADGNQLNSLASGQIEGIGTTARGAVKDASGETSELVFDPSAGAVDHHAAMRAILGWLRKAGYESSVVAVGHRVVHGGPDLVEPMLVDAGALTKLKRLIPLAPLHQPHNIAGIEAAMRAFPSTPQVACFDTAFHRTQPFVSDTFALPRSYYDEGVRRYGFHGLSYEYITRKLRHIAPESARADVIVAHLGNGASMCAVREGRSIASTMGFTALDGLPMGTRCGQIDPGVLLYWMAEKKMGAEEISDLLYKNSGLRVHVRHLAGHEGAGSLRQCGGARRHRLFSSPASGASSERSRRPSAERTPSSSRPASASTPGACEKPPSQAWNGWASISTRRPTEPARRSSARPPLPSRFS